MAYQRNIPQANQLLSVSQSDILNNFNGSDDTFNIDHYAFSNTTPNIGFHKKITSPDQSGHPASPLTNPTIYGTSQAGTNLGILQYSKGPNRLDQGNQISTPLTFIQSQEAAISMTSGSTINIFDFTGITRCFARLTVGNFSSTTSRKYLTTCDLWFKTDAPPSPVFALNNIGDSTSLTPQTTGYILQVKNNASVTISNVYWTLQFLRVQA